MYKGFGRLLAYTLMYLLIFSFATCTQFLAYFAFDLTSNNYVVGTAVEDVLNLG